MIITAFGQQTIVMYPPIALFVAPNYDYHCNRSANYRDVSSDSMILAVNHDHNVSKRYAKRNDLERNRK